MSVWASKTAGQACEVCGAPATQYWKFSGGEQHPVCDEHQQDINQATKETGELSSKTAGLGLASMSDGDTKQFESEGLSFTVKFRSWGAMGDDNQPARGYTKGEYTVEGPEGSRYFEHSPNGPSLGGAKRYAADQAEQYIVGLIQKKKMDRLFHSSKTADVPSGWNESQQDEEADNDVEGTSPSNEDWMPTGEATADAPFPDYQSQWSSKTSAVCRWCGPQRTKIDYNGLTRCATCHDVLDVPEATKKKELAET